MKLNTLPDDSAVDGGESVKLGFGTLPAKVERGLAPSDETVVSITDNDVAGATTWASPPTSRSTAGIRA